MRLIALNRLGNVGGHDASEAIIAVIRDGDERTAAHAANVVTRKRLWDAIPAVIDRLDSLGSEADPTCVWLMVNTLAMSADARAIPVLERLVAGSNRGVRKRAAAALGAIGVSEASDALERGCAGFSRLRAWRLRRMFERSASPGRQRRLWRRKRRRQAKAWR